MDYLKKYKKQTTVLVSSGVLAPVLMSTVGFYVSSTYFFLPNTQALFVAISSGLVIGLLSVFLLSIKLSQPLEKVESIISYALNSSRVEDAPDIQDIKLGRELISSQSLRIYDLASSTSTKKNIIAQDSTTNPQTGKLPINADSMLNALFMPIIGIDSSLIVTTANEATAKYINKPLQDIIGKPLYDSLELSFREDQTFDEWFKTVHESSVTATRTWERVRHQIEQNKYKQFDLVASFSSGSSSGTEAFLSIFDKSEQYNQDDQEVGFVALAVHELRTPLTIMRGYIEVFEDELAPTLTPELAEFMHKMHASAQQLTAFVSNILNVARVEEDQLVLKLRSESMAGILNSAISDLRLRAQVHGKTIELNIAENLPPVAADGVSVHEVINNLVDNAIKYSGKTDKIIVSCGTNSEGLVETSVQDFGIGIPASVMGSLFQKFHRSHKSRVQIGGTGLGLYLSKALIIAHGGNIWVRSKEGEGSIFSFTLLPFDKLSSEQVSGEDGIIRGAHGWIKNHSLYRN